MKFQLPRLSRINSARVFFGLEMALLWSSLAVLIAVNVLALQKSRPAYWDRLMMLFEAPLSVPRSIDLAALLWNQGYKKEARDVLGATTDSLKTLTKWEEEAAALENKYAFWQSVAAARPDYRDAFITLAATAYQLGKLDEARSWLSRASTLDPNSPTAQALVRFIH